MKLTNLQITNINNVLGALADTKVTGAFKFKLFKTAKRFAAEAKDIIDTLDFDDNGTSLPTEGNKEILEMDQEINLEPLTEDELSELPLSISDLAVLEPIIIKGEK
ncbi:MULTISPECIES: hypothetical protein [Aerococcus]|uniref:Uncharacterized protein n=5 Tax=Aerococcus TaxID=1375 RepID=A0A329NSP6_9LACT|nr:MULTISPECIES: hypothetical protein [Aerococcus]MDK6882021.1 hypothetical protein [Escherichia coli]KAA9242158.1 hypothetical protein F6I34_01520 [Aerococcus urinae]KAA9298639.1 hypothetical protein F6I08_04675 [Aerococcus tenax]MCY3026231.1 hypothetical protein [Aerococcus loyolae]MCY3035156.1 hypothetical protein [Aerococcus mictus]